MAAKLKICLLNTFALLFGLGSEGKQTLGKMLMVADMYRHSLEHPNNVWFAAFDTHFASQRQAPDSVPDPLAPHFIEAKLLDPEVRRRLCETGKVWCLPLEALMRSGIRVDGMGTGQDPAWGRILYIMNRLPVINSIEKGLRTFASSRRQVEATVKRGDAAQDAALPCVIFTSDAGGVGVGALPLLARDIRETARSQGVKVKIIACLIDLGTLYPANKQIAQRNRQVLLSELRTKLCGTYVEPGQGPSTNDEPLVDMVLAISNANGSQLTTLDSQEYVAAHAVYHLCCSPLGERLREDVVDVDGNRGQDEHGTPRAVSSAGVAVVDFDRDRLRRFASARLAFAIADAVLNADPGDACEQGRQAAGQLSLIENDLQNQTNRALAASHDRGPAMHERAQEAFNSRLEGYRPWHGLEPIDDAAQAVIGQVIPDVLEPQMEERAEAIIEAVKERSSNELSLRGQELAGLQRAQAWRDGIRPDDRGDGPGCEGAASLPRHRDVLRPRDQVACARQRCCGGCFR